MEEINRVILDAGLTMMELIIPWWTLWL